MAPYSSTHVATGQGSDCATELGAGEATPHPGLLWALQEGL